MNITQYSHILFIYLFYFSSPVLAYTPYVSQ